MILQALTDHPSISVRELHERFNVSEVTIRKDLNNLSERNLIIRTHGGALRKIYEETKDDLSINNKKLYNRPAKQAIGRLASTLIEDGDTIVLDSGTTTLEIARNLEHFHNLTIITNGLNIAGELLNYKRFNVIVLGGNVRTQSQSTVGPIAESNLKIFYSDKLFLGVDSFSLENGLSTPNIEEANINRTMMSMAKEVVAVFDSTKVNRRSFAFIGKVDEVNTIVSDSNMPQNVRSQIKSRGINLHIADI